MWEVRLLLIPINTTPWRCTRWFKYDRDCLHLFTYKLVPVIFEPPCMWEWTFRSTHSLPRWQMRVGGHRDAAVALPAGKSKWLPLCMTQGGTHGQYVRVWRKENVVPRPNWNPEQMVVDDQHKSVGGKAAPRPRRRMCECKSDPRILYVSARFDWSGASPGRLIFGEIAHGTLAVAHRPLTYHSCVYGRIFWLILLRSWPGASTFSKYGSRITYIVWDDCETGGAACDLCHEIYRLVT